MQKKKVQTIYHITIYSTSFCQTNPKLKLKDGTILTNDILGFRAYAKLNTEEKAIYNDLKKRHSRQFTCFAITLVLVTLIFSVNSGGSTSNGKVFLGDGPPI